MQLRAPCALGLEEEAEKAQTAAGPSILAPY